MGDVEDHVVVRHTISDVVNSPEASILQRKDIWKL